MTGQWDDLGTIRSFMPQTGIVSMCLWEPPSVVLLNLCTVKHLQRNKWEKWEQLSHSLSTFYLYTDDMEETEDLYYDELIWLAFMSLRPQSFEEEVTLYSTERGHWASQQVLSCLHLHNKNCFFAHALPCPLPLLHIVSGSFWGKKTF